MSRVRVPSLTLSQEAPDPLECGSGASSFLRAAEAWPCRDGTTGCLAVPAAPHTNPGYGRHGPPAGTLRRPPMLTEPVRTARVDLVPLRVDHAAEMAGCFPIRRCTPSSAVRP
ncbi:hypothetical protein GCM10018787_52340 [Streptomyces thermodiastaticus]|nr:hypothetical protein GCM10018787_52340 [Streptomyces thermodiastaticus]